MKRKQQEPADPWLTLVFTTMCGYWREARIG